jgi:hypothetical protein
VRGHASAQTAAYELRSTPPQAGDYLITMDVREDAPVEYDHFTGALSGRESIAPTLKQTLDYLAVMQEPIVVAVRPCTDPGR